MDSRSDSEMEKRVDSTSNTKYDTVTQQQTVAWGDKLSIKQVFMAKLNQIIAAEKGVKSRAESSLTEAYHLIQKPDLFTGLTRKYEAIDDAGEKRPPENKRLQNRVPDLIVSIRASMVAWFDTVATKERTNTKAKADVIVDGTVVLKDVPVAGLLFLEKRLVDMRTFASKLPELDATETWNWNEGAHCFVTDPIQKASTKKVAKPVVMHEATKEHPAQVVAVNEDVIVGYWTESKQSGAVESSRIAALLTRIEKLQTAVKFAREEANSIPVEDAKIGEAVLGYIFA